MSPRDMDKGLLLIIAWCMVTAVDANYWSRWTRWSACSRTCDGGAAYQTRKCVRSRAYDFGCKGRSIRYSTCNNKPCPSDLPDFRSEQCAAYNDASYAGRLFHWLPYHDPDNACALSCLAEGTKMVAILAPIVLDGTRCNSHSMDMCINGKCMKVGCDHQLGSKLKMDACGVCGGNDTCSHGNRGEAGRYRWIETGYGRCSVSCGVGHKEKRLLCFDAYLGKVMDTTVCTNLIKPTVTAKTCSTGSCPPEWRVGPWQNCTRDCGGGVSWRIVTCVKTFDDGTQQWVRDSFCSSLRPSSRKSCNGYICPTWYAGEWSVCSVSCGMGGQTREVVCRYVGETYCREGAKPRTAKNCTTGIPCFTLTDRRYTGRVYISGDIQERNVGEFRASSDTEQALGDQPLDKEALYVPGYVHTDWDSCSASCGEGIRFRFVRCQVYLKYIDNFVDLPDTDCEDEKPEEYEACFIEPCYDDYEWTAAGMTECSQTCLGGIQETIMQCVHKENRTAVQDSYCLEAAHLQTERRVCNDRPCPQMWRLGNYGDCSASCGGGTRIRKVECIQEYAQGPSILNLPDFMCTHPTPDRAEKCNLNDCPAHWNVTGWSACSVTCGLGITTRRPFCQRKWQDGRTENVSRSQCDPELKPKTEKTCNQTTCPEPMIRKTNIRLFQLNKMRKLRLFVGMKASVLPGTTLVLKCPHVGLDRQKVTWFRNGLKFRKMKRSRVTQSGTLRIRHSRPGRDEGVYSCLIGGLEANMSLAFSSSFDVLQASITRETYIKGALSPEDDIMNGSFLEMDPVDRRLKRMYLLTTDWSYCTVTCNGGLQSRNMTCEVITSNYYEVHPIDTCFQHLAGAPLMLRSCATKPCVMWRPGNWSECSADECVRNLYSLQRRPIECTLEFNDTQADEQLCQSLGFPPDSVRDCYSPDCVPAWNTSRWSQCVSECDEKGFKTRMLTCLWTKTAQLAPQGSCDHLTTPRITRKCKGVPCSSIVCKDESDYCSIVKMLKMCDYSNFYQRCCLSCSEYYDYEDNAAHDDRDVIDS